MQSVEPPALGAQAPSARTGALHLAALLAITLITPLDAKAQDCGTWSPLPAGGHSDYGIGYGGGILVAVGTTGTERSADGGLTWTPAPIDLQGGVLVRVAWSGSLWVAVGDGGAVFTSPDGAAWTPRNSNTTRSLAGLVRANGLWVAVGERETVITSPDGVTWTKRREQGAGYLSSVAWVGNGFVAVGEGGAVVTSPDGTSWDKTTVPGEGWLTDVAWTGTQQVATAFDGTIWVRNALTPWTAVAETGAGLRRVLWTGAKLIAVGDESAILGGPDPATWEPETITGAPPVGSLTGIAWTGESAVVVGSPTGVLRSHCGIWADASIVPQAPQIGQTITVSAVKSQGFGLARWQFGEVGCDGADAIRELPCLSNPCAFTATFAYATPGQKTISLYGWAHEMDGSGNRVFVLVRQEKITVASSGSCATCLAPGLPGNPSPPQGAVVPGGTIQFQWSPPPSGTPPFSYDVELDGGTVCAGVTATSCQVAGVAETASLHDWQVVARNACGERTSAVWSFAACSAPALPVADFDWSPLGPMPSWPAQQQPFVGQAVTFHDLSTNGPSTWAWSGLSGGGALPDQAPQVSWWSPGARLVGLQAGNCLGWSAEKSRTITVAPDVRPRVMAFDFGTDGSPVAAGFTRVTASTLFTPAAGFGWLSGTVAGRDRGGPDELTRDFAFTTNATFAVDVPNRTYDVAVWLGDSAYPHDRIAIYLEGQQVDEASTAAGSVVQRVYRVGVTDGRLTVRIADLGGVDPNAVVNGIEVFAADAVRVDFGTTSSPVAAGFARASEATTFGVPLWCGWADGMVSSRDRGTGTETGRDLDVTRDGTFSCAVAPGVYDVALEIGDAASGHDQIGVFLEGAQVDSVSRSAGQFARPSYRVRVADGDLTLRLADLGGNDANAVINSLQALRVGPFDFGTPTSPVADGFVQVTNGTRYAPAVGFGWLVGAVGSRDRGIGDDVVRDLDVTTGATFVVDVPNGAYDVTVVMGDAASAHDDMAVVIEGVDADVVTVAKGKYYARTFRTTVADSQLTVRFEDRGGSDLNVVVNSLSLAPAR